MGIEQWYVSKTNEGNFGDVFLLNQLQEKTASGGGENLLGSPAQRIKVHSGFFGLGDDYPIPHLFGNPRALITKLNSLKTALGITGDVTNKINLAGSTSTVHIEKKKLFNIGIGVLPFLPLSGGIDLDFSKTKDLTLTFGAGTYLENINGGFLSQLYNHLDGKPTADIGGNFLKDNYFIKEILVAKNYTVSFTSIDDFKADFNAKLDAFKILPEITAKNINFSSKNKRTLDATISGDTEYVIGLTASTWKSLK
jgi:hypothetical protein